MNWASIDPGSPSGLTIWNESGKHVLTSTLKYVNALDFCERIKKMTNHYGIHFILLERFVIFKTGKKSMFRTYNASEVKVQIRLWKEMFPDRYIDVHPSQ